MFKKSAKAMTHTRTLAAAAMLSALYAALYSAKIPLAAQSRLSLTFLPVVAAAYLLGTVPAVTVGLCGDLLSCLFFPSGQYFPGFTLTSVLVGLIYGVFLSAKPLKAKKVRVIAANFAVVLLLYTLLNTFWLAILYEKAYFVYLVSRLVKNLIVFPVQTLLCFVLLNLLDKTGITKKYK